MLTVNENISIPIREFEFRYSRSPGPGGQNVNKVNTKVTLRWNYAESKNLPEPVKQRMKQKFSRRINKEGELIITSHRFRDQGRNVADSLNKLKDLILSVAKSPTPRKKTRPSKASKQRRLDSKKRTSEKKRSRNQRIVD